MNARKDKTARILSSIWGSSYKVEELCGGTPAAKRREVKSFD